MYMCISIVLSSFYLPSHFQHTIIPSIHPNTFTSYILYITPRCTFPSYYVHTLLFYIGIYISPSCPFSNSPSVSSTAYNHNCLLSSIHTIHTVHDIRYHPSPSPPPHPPHSNRISFHIISSLLLYHSHTYYHSIQPPYPIKRLPSHKYRTYIVLLILSPNAFSQFIK